MKKITLSNANVSGRSKALRVGAAGLLVSSSLALGGCVLSDPAGDGRNCTDSDTGVYYDTVGNGDRCSDSD